MFEKWACAFVLTLIIEYPVVCYGFRQVNFRLRISAFFAANLISHFSLWFLFPRFEPYFGWLMFAELGVVLIEATIYRLAFKYSCSTKQIVFVCLSANFLSTVAGLIIYFSGIQLC